MGQEIVINRVSAFSVDTADALRNLASQIGENYQEMTDDDLREMIASPNHALFTASINDTIAGMILVMIYRIPYVRKAYLDDLSVDKAFRGKGVGTLLLNHAVAFAEESGAAYVDFTSRPERIDGNTLYGKLGFKKRETNIYRKIFHYGKTK